MIVLLLGLGLAQAEEFCNGIDDDADGLIDNDDYQDLGPDSGCLDLFLDGDRDGYGNSKDLACLCPPKVTGDPIEVELGSELYISVQGDCNDAESSIYPGAPELLSGWDEDCDGRIAWSEADCDGDRYMAIPGAACVGDEAVACFESTFEAVCDAETGWLMLEVQVDVSLEKFAGDCDDTDQNIFPSAPEVAGDGVDQDCDGEDEPLPEETGSDSGPDTGESEVLSGGCDCSTQGGSLAGLWALGMVGLFWRRRRALEP